MGRLVNRAGRKQQDQCCNTNCNLQWRCKSRPDRHNLRIGKWIHAEFLAAVVQSPQIEFVTLALRPKTAHPHALNRRRSTRSMRMTMAHQRASASAPVIRHQRGPVRRYNAQIEVD